MAGVVVKLDANPLRSPIVGRQEDVIFCPCDFRCEFEELAFANNQKDTIKNDVTDFLFKKVTPLDTISLELIKNGVKVAEIADNTYGTFYNGFTNAPLYVGFQCDWTNVYSIFSGGKYKIRARISSLGQDTEEDSRTFFVQLYDSIEAHRTIKITTKQSGNFLNTLFDYSGLTQGGWNTSIRLRGVFEMQPEAEIDIYEDSSYRQIQNRDITNRKYTLRLFKLPETIIERISIQDMLANEIFITSYNLFSDRIYDNLPVAFDSFGEVAYDGLGFGNMELNFTDRQKNIIKHNFK